MDTTFDFLQKMGDYFAALDWTYIFTFIIISYVLINKIKISKLSFLSRINITWKVLAIGIAWGCVIYLLRDYTRKDVEMLAASMFTGMVLHSAVFKWLFEKLEKKQ